MNNAALQFNREILFGECGALLAANPTAICVSHFTSNAAVISGAAVAGTLMGGGLFWLGARVYDKAREQNLDSRALAADIGYFAPAALILGFVVYDPSIYLTSHYFLKQGDRVFASVLVGQAVAFGLFLACMNLYRIQLLRVLGKRL
jgi:hypothetical protein